MCVCACVRVCVCVHVKYMCTNGKYSHHPYTPTYTHMYTTLIVVDYMDSFHY